MICEEVLAGEILIVHHLSADRPEIGVDVEEVHIYGNLYGFRLEHLGFECLGGDHDTAVGYGRDEPVRSNGIALWNHEEHGLPDAEPRDDDKKGPEQPGAVDEQDQQGRYYGRNDVYEGQAASRVLVQFHIRSGM